MLKVAESLSREAAEIFATIMRFMGDAGKKPSPKQEVEYLVETITTDKIDNVNICAVCNQQGNQHRRLTG